MHNGKFIVFEGIDGSGKSTQCKILEKNLLKQEIACRCTEEPYNGIVGHYIRDILNSKKNEITSSKTVGGILAYLFAADRYEHVHASDGILHTLSHGTSVICDRYLYSSLAYQGHKELRTLVNLLNKDFPNPDIIFYFDARIKTALQRIEKTKEADAMENKRNLINVKKRYEEIFENDTYKTKDGKYIPVHKIIAEQPLEVIAQDVLQKTLQIYKQ